MADDEDAKDARWKLIRKVISTFEQGSNVLVIAPEVRTLLSEMENADSFMNRKSYEVRKREIYRQNPRIWTEPIDVGYISKSLLNPYLMTVESINITTENIVQSSTIRDIKNMVMGHAVLIGNNNLDERKGRIDPDTHAIEMRRLAEAFFSFPKLFEQYLDNILANIYERFKGANFVVPFLDSISTSPDKLVEVVNSLGYMKNEKLNFLVLGHRGNIIDEKEYLEQNVPSAKYNVTVVK